MDETGRQKQGIIAILLASIIMGMAFSGMYLSKSCSFEAFYDVGNVYEEFTYALSQGIGIVYNNESGKLEIQEAEACQYWTLPQKLEGYNYVIINLAGLSQEYLDVLFQFYSGENLVDEIPVQLQEGENILEITDKTATILYMRMYQKQGLAYKVKAVEYRESLPVWNGRVFTFASLLFSFCCASILFLCRWVMRKRGIKLSAAMIQEPLQKIFLKITDKINWKPLTPKMAHFWRRVLFFFVIVIISYGERANISQAIFSRNVKICCITLLAIALISLERQRKMRNWSHPLASSWFWLVGCMAVSFFIVPKSVNFGMIYLIVFGFFFFVWGNMERPEEMVHDLCFAIKGEFWLSMVYFCFFFPEQAGYAYQGDFLNPNPLALYLSVSSCVFLTELLDETKRTFFFFFFSAVGFGFSACMIWKTQCRSVASGLLLAILVAGYILLRSKDSEKKGRRVLCRFALMAFIIAGMFLGHTGINTFHVRENQENVLGNGRLSRQKDNFTLQVEAADLHNNKFLKKIFESRSLNEFTSQRIIYWKGYLRQVNFWGHKPKAVINERRRSPHNDFLNIAYRYGVLSVIPYLFYLFYYVFYGYRYFRYYRGQRRYAVFPMMLILVVFPFLLLDILELPFRHVAWFILYLTTGILFEGKTEWKKE